MGAMLPVRGTSGKPTWFPSFPRLTSLRGYTAPFFDKDAVPAAEPKRERSQVQRHASRPIDDAERPEPSPIDHHIQANAPSPVQL
ncbi:hypothetical protein VTH06DRAFT_5580 [Thermothelomyces fergusii]